MGKYPMVETPLKIGTLTLKNRIIMAPMGTQYSDKGYVTDKLIHYYVERARGGAALIVTEHTAISEAAKGSPDMLAIADESYTAGIKKLTEAIQSAGALHALELNFSGRNIEPADVTEEMMNQIADDWASAAVRSKECGVSCVIVHMANGYMLHRFLSPVFNTRTDAYGGTAEKRARFPEMVLKRVRKAVGDDYPVWVRMCVTEELPGGFTVEDAVVTAKIMEAAGADALDLSAGGQTSFVRVHPTYYREDGLNMEEGRTVKHAVGIPTYCGGKIRSLAQAESYISKGYCDGVFMARPLLADPYLVKKSLEGREDEITLCLSCNNCNKSSAAGCLHCTVNPYAGHEGDIPREKTSHPKKVLVMGGGVTGMICAEACANAGHHVILVEKEKQFGGNVSYAAIPPRKERLADYIKNLAMRIKKAGVEVLLNKELTESEIEEIHADVIVLATGAVPRIPTFLPGLDTMTNLLTFKDVLIGSEPEAVGKKVLILGGGEVGAEMADYLTEYGREVTIVEMAPAIITDATKHVQLELGKRLSDKNVKVYVSTKVSGFDHNCVKAELENGEQIIFENYDNVILSMGLVPTGNDMQKLVEGKAKQIFNVGDSNRPRGIASALEDALMVVTQIEE